MKFNLNASTTTTATKKIVVSGFTAGGLKCSRPRVCGDQSCSSSRSRNTRSPPTLESVVASSESKGERLNTSTGCHCWGCYQARGSAIPSPGWAFCRAAWTLTLGPAGSRKNSYCGVITSSIYTHTHTHKHTHRDTHAHTHTHSNLFSSHTSTIHKQHKSHLAHTRIDTQTVMSRCVTDTSMHTRTTYT